MAFCYCFCSNTRLKMYFWYFTNNKISPMFVVRFEKYLQNIFHIIKFKYFSPNSRIFKMSEYNQKSHEDTYQYKNRIFALWKKERTQDGIRNSLFSSKKFFVRIFINGIYNYQVQTEMKKWLREEKNPKIEDAVEAANKYHQEEQDAENYLPDFDDVDNNNDCYGAGHICI